ncbi:hypothetical protein M2323_003509 [Rhodoblastus acidophilus]|uniref:hypothetical protein n=1 Tax=Rhodoblastus acidophilus TaxID=1074 RepID=UPI002224609E|nr:hypothetical protein [Rhodoblastus acidophilus]MCW2285674.1 hypothetical protein [Rhodoblastus acidophilus]MCW2334568.1 hypothetical protein [Rhodoblastus acidophilus]
MRKTLALAASIWCLASPACAQPNAAQAPNPGLDGEIKIVLSDGAESYIRASTCDLLGLGSDERETKGRLFYSNNDRLEHRLDVVDGGKHVVLGLFDLDSRLRCFYLTDASAVLARAVCGTTRENAQVVTDKKAARAFQRELGLWRKTLGEGR